MKRYWTIVGVVFFFFATLFLVVEWLNPAFLDDPQSMMNQGSATAALVGIVLLVADVLLPVPSSFVMIANGMLYGIALGTLLSLIGYTSSSLVGFLIGRHSIAILTHLVPPHEQQRANQLLEQWGWLAVLVTRPLPLLAETTSIMAGASTMSSKTMMLATVSGSFPIALLYAITGATAAQWDSVLLAFGISVFIAGIFLLAGRFWPPSFGQDKQSAVSNR
ncbi:VTT domain-containing protein [Chloroflexi bacterium TSY]|nr:VTT domain-containing protein [Chloroflexi bacterium TSY]